MNNWLDIFKHLLPTGRAWRITTEKQLRQFFDGLTGLPDDVRNYFAGLFLDIFPTTTTALERWLDEFNLVSSGNDAVDRQNLAGAWILNEYQSPAQIQETLQAAGFDVYVHEWWALPRTTPPVPINPNGFIGRFEVGAISLAGEPFMECGEPSAQCGALGLVQIPTEITGLDNTNMFLDDPAALLDNFILPDGYALVNKTDEDIQYNPPGDAQFWPFFLYIGGQIFPNNATIPLARKNEFETLLLRISPTQQWLGVLVDYV